MPDATDTEDYPPVHYPAVWIAIATGCGIVVDKTTGVTFEFHLILAALALGGFAWATFRSLAILRLAFCLTLIMATGSLWHHAYWNFYRSDNIGRWATDEAAPVCLTAKLLTEPRHVAIDPANEHLNRPRDQTQQSRVLVSCLSIRDGQTWRPASGRIQLTMPVPSSALHAGDEVLIFAQMRSIGPPSNPGEFDFQSYYRRQRILVSLNCWHPESLTVLRRAPSRSWSATLRSGLNDLAWRYLRPNQASLASAVLLGNREQLTATRREVFLHTGTVHLLAISGLHVGILACCFFAFFRCGWLNRNTCLLLTIAFVMFYAWLVEFRPPVVRASILIVLFCVARIFGRAGLSYNVLAMAALIVLAINPTDLFSLGTQLSFLAVLSIGFGNRWIFNRQTDPLSQLIVATRTWPVQLLYWVRENLWAAFVISSLIWMISIPLVAASFHVLAPIGLVVNPLILLPIAIALYAGISIFAFGNLFSPVASVAAFVCTLSLGFIETLVGWASGVPMSHFFTSGPPWPSVVIFYLGWVVLALFPPTRTSLKRLSMVAVAWLLLGWYLPIVGIHVYRSQIQQSLTTTFIDVGHGTAVLIQMPHGKNVIYDCGSTISSRFATQNVSNVLWHHHIAHIDAIIVSHADIDHFNGIPELTNRFSIGTIYLSPMMNRHPSASVAELKRSLAEHDIAISVVAAGDRINIDPAVSIDVIAPRSDSKHRNDNSASIVMAVEYQGRRILLPGDLEKEGLDRLLAAPPKHFDLVMAAHHGSSHSSPHQFCQWATPDFLAVSCGSKKFSAITADAAETFGCRLLRTDRDGAIEFEIAKDGSMTFRSFLNDNGFHLESIKTKKGSPE